MAFLPSWPSAWPALFRFRDANTRSCWGYTFQWTDEHLPPERAESMKLTYDVLGEECLEILNEICPPARVEEEKRGGREGLKEEVVSEVLAGSKLATGTDSAPAPTTMTVPATTAEEKAAAPAPPTSRPPKRDLFALLRENRHRHPKLQELWNDATTTPPWVDWDQICRGQKVFYRYGGATLTGLAYQSLLGGMGAARIVEVLSRTGGFSVKVARHRLFETTQHLLSCTLSLDSVQAPDGEGFTSSLRVRLLHAAVRKRIMTLAKSRPGYYDIQRNGIPINDLDCMATIASFSATILFISLPRQLIFPTQREIEDYIALWRLIAHYTGTPTEYFATPAKARAIMETLLYTEVAPSPMSAVLANNIILALADVPPAYASKSFLMVNARWLNGNELCDALNLGRPSGYYWALMVGQCLFFAGICYTYRSIPYLDKRKIAMLRRVLWAVIVEGKHGLKGEKSVFEFKYVPDFGVSTRLGDVEVKEKMEKEALIGEIGGKGVEVRNLQTLGVVLVGMVVVGVGGAWVARRVLGWMV